MPADMDKVLALVAAGFTADEVRALMAKTPAPSPPVAAKPIFRRPRKAPQPAQEPRAAPTPAPTPPLTPEAAGARDAAKDAKARKPKPVIVKCQHCRQACVGKVGRAAHIMFKHPQFGTDAQRAAPIKLEMNHDGRSLKFTPANKAKAAKVAEPGPEPLDITEQTVLAEVLRNEEGTTMRQAAKAASIAWVKCEHILERLVKAGVLRVEVHGVGPATYVGNR